MNNTRLLIFSAPSGSGKTTIVQWLLQNHPELNLHFSISCTSRPPRGNEQHGKEYFFLTNEQFRQYIEEDAFVEYEEVYKGCYYGTLKQQVEQQRRQGHNIIFDVDVKGGCKIKQQYRKHALSIFIQPPSVAILKERLMHRATDSPEVIQKRIEKATYELTFADYFDHVVVNDNLQQAEEEVYQLVKNFLDEE